MANTSHNPLSKLLDIDFPEVKRSNWNCNHDIQTTADVGYAIPVMVDRILANTHVKMDINQASFANPTVAPLYGRYRVKYLAFWAPDRLYIPEWRDGDAMVGDDYPYPILPLPTKTSQSQYNSLTGNSSPYVPYTSLLSYLGLYPAMTQSYDWDPDDMPTPSNALPLLAYWDIYRHYILNVQEDTFPIRVSSFVPAHRDNGLSVAASNPRDTRISRDNLDNFFTSVRKSMSEGSYDISLLYASCFGSAFSIKKVVSGDIEHQSFDASNINSEGVVMYNNYHYGLPLVPYGPDMFTSWVSNENVELEREQSRIVMPVSNGQATMTMDSWVLASRIQNKVRKSIFKNSDFAEYIDVQYGIKPPTTLTKPMFLGAFVSDIVFNDVISSVQGGDGSSKQSLDSNQNLGSRAGYGRGTDYDKHNFIEFTAEEPGTLMVIQMIVPEVFYFEGRDEMYDVQNFNEEFNPAFDGVGFTPLQTSTLNMVPNLRLSPGGTASALSMPYSEYNQALGQQPYGMRHMAKVNLLKGQMSEYGSYLPYSLARSFNYVRSLFYTQTQSRTDYYSSYIIPEMFTNIFASSVQDNFQFYLNFDYLKYQPISKQFLSFNH